MKVGKLLILGLISYISLFFILSSHYCSGFCFSWQQVREHYLRDDIYCGASICKKCDSSVARLSASTSPILVLDTNVVLTQVIFVQFLLSTFHFQLVAFLWNKTFLQIDLLENPAIDDVVMLSVVLDEVKNKNLSVYNRVRALCGNPLRRFFVFSNEHHKYVFSYPFINTAFHSPLWSILYRLNLKHLLAFSFTLG